MQFKLTLASLVAAAYAQDLNSTISGNSQLSSLAGLLAASPAVVQQLGSAQNITLLAPSNNAIAALLNTTAGQQLSSNPGRLAAILQYHVLQGLYNSSAVTNTSAFIPSALTNQSYTNVTGGQRVQAVRVSNNVTVFSGLQQRSNVTQADIAFSGGVIHVIDRVLTLPTRVNSTLIEANLTALYGALTNTSLLTTVNNARDITIFAPNNAAFQAIGSATGSLSSDALAGILRYHVVAGNNSAPLYSSSLANGTLTTLNGGSITVRRNGTNIYVNGARVIGPNYLVANGVVHVIDGVLNPANATATANEPAFSGASSGTNVPFTSGITATPTASVGGGAAGATTTTSSALAAKMTAAAGMGAAALLGLAAAVL